MSIHQRYAVFGVVIFSALVGCSTPMGSGYLSDYKHLEKSQYLERYFADEVAIASRDYGKIVLGSVSTEAIRDQKGITEADCGKWLYNVLIEDSTASEPVVVSSGISGPPAQLRVAITEMTPGSAGARIVAGELGAGHAWVQIEGTVIDSQTNATLVSFVDRRRSSGAIGLKDVGGDSGPSLVRAMIEDIGKDIRRELSVSFKNKQSKFALPN